MQLTSTAMQGNLFSGDTAQKQTPPQTMQTPPADPAATLAAAAGAVAAIANGAAAALAPQIDALREEIKGAKEEAAEAARAAAEAAANAHAPNITHFHLPEIPKEITLPEGETAHPALNELLPRIRCGVNCYLYGPTGSGKTYLARQAAAVLFPDMDESARFGSLSVSGEVTASDIFGKLIPEPAENGQLSFSFHESEFTRIYRNGGVFLFDELDAADPQTAIVVNSAIANGELSFPILGRIKKNPQAYILAAGNTTGHGATQDYTGRTALASASLNRFRYIAVDYDTELESRLANAYTRNADKAAAVLEARDTARRAVETRHITRTFFSTRTVIDYSKLAAAGLFKSARAILDDFAQGLPEQKRKEFLAATH
jgi:MoxR-like ATPase